MDTLSDVKTLVTENWIKTPTNINRSNYKWVITNFSMHPEVIGTIIKSPTFSASHYDQFKWCLKLYPNGHTMYYIPYMGLFLELTSANNTHSSNVKTNFIFSILNDKGVQINCQIKKGTIFSQGCSDGTSSYIERNLLLNKDNGLLPGDTLTIICHITMIFDSVNISDKNKLKEPDYESKFCQDLNHLFENKKFCDVTLIVGNSEIQAHKTILAARSVVFDAMFKHEMTESKLSRVFITDSSYEVIQEILRFIYTAKVPHLNKMADELLIAAEKYDLKDLKELCEKELCDILSVETAIYVLIFADLHHAHNLKAQTIAFISVNATDILKTQGWLNLVTSHKHLVTEAVEAIAKWNGPPRKRTKY